MPEPIALGQERASGAEALVLEFLKRMEARDLAGAAELLAPGVEMRFPGAQPFHSLEALVAWAAPRYRFVRKSYDRVESVARDGVTVVYAKGVLAGEWPDGAPFSGVRFIDRFEVGPDGVRLQEVWNDIAEVRPQ